MITSDDELDAKLRQLFADDRLGGLQPKEGAGETIVAGARRRRNRRKTMTAAGGVAMASVLVVGGVTFAKVQERDTQAAMSTAASQAAASGAAPESTGGGGTALPAPPGQTSQSNSAPLTTSTTQKTTPTTAAKPDGPTKIMTGSLLGHSGLGNLTLGMTEAQLTAAGIIFAKESGTTCAFGKVTKVTGQVGDIRIYLSETAGVTAILPASSHTPEGVGTGSTVEDVGTIYKVPTNGQLPSVNLGTTSYEFALSNSKVKSVVLKANNRQGCG
ncbi:hypothetical protein [Amycolatopsis sp. NPDC059657]|uniref:hypothetical protein n=1 Tax=Amycolatopsis sp. NPDC059657 TaxID=3346899 RepID=UPI00366F5900